MHLLLIIPHEQVSQFDAGRPCKKEKRKKDETEMPNTESSTGSKGV